LQAAALVGAKGKAWILEIHKGIVNQKPFKIMKSMLTVLSVLAFFMGYTQADLLPSELIQATKNKGVLFDVHQLFQPATTDDYGLSRQLQTYEVLQLDEDALDELRHSQPELLSLVLPAGKRGQTLELELAKVNLFAPDFRAILASGRELKLAPGLHYRGLIKGQEGSIAALSLFEGEVMGLFSSKRTGNLVLGALEQGRAQQHYVLYDDREVLRSMDIDCASSDDGPDYRPEQLEMPAGDRAIGDCVGIYLEIDHDVFLNKGGASGTANFITGLFNQIATLYANENISINLSELHLWDVPSPYYGSSSYNMLTGFVQQRPTFNGNLGQLISYKASGGIAYLAGLCNPYSPKHGFSSISASYNTVPTYSWSVMVVAHELGHLFGAKHTHACAWNGNNTAIDGCAGFVEGSCPNPGNPAGGGTMMSYCHITSVGINFSKGFGTQPGNVMRNAVANASCLQACSDDGGGGPVEPGGDSCEGQEVTLSITLDAYGSETRWRIRDTNQLVLYSGGPYINNANGSLIEQKLCLEEGCYSFEIFDSYGDGICCAYGQGRYILKDSSGLTITSGGAFAYKDSIGFCLPLPAPDSVQCLEIDFSGYEILSHGGAQDAGFGFALAGGEVLYIGNNAWKAISLDYEVTPNTVLEFEFGSTIRGEIHGIGFDDNNSISANYTFRLFGIQNWGISAFNNYPGNGTWQKYTIPVGQYYTGRFNRLFFAADHDRLPANGNSFFRKVKIYEGSACEDEPDGNAQFASPNQFELPGHERPMRIYPNPARDWLSLELNSPLEGPADIQVFSAAGQLVATHRLGVLPGPNQHQLDVSSLPAGAYVLRIAIGTELLVERLSITR
jgi:hypothetical protein